MIVRAITLFVLLAASIYVGVMLGVRRFAVMGMAPMSMRSELQLWGFIYLSLGALLFTAACTLAFYWLAQALHKKKQ